jgi:hypothetical protein
VHISPLLLKTLKSQEMIVTFNQFREQLTESQLKKLLSHFDAIYECESLGEHELKITYLAYLWKNNQVVITDFGYEIIDPEKLGIDVFKDYEITFEQDPEDAGGVNLGITYDYYNFIELFEIV